ncbi:MAG TPA: hypothetical protein GX707_10210 [Epulopiscium sp.]|nr:hypothetical protein [Candidatus Epulonipiscium sp.]
MYKCYICKRQFVEGKMLDPVIIWEEYTKGKQAYQQLAEKYNCSKRTIQRKIDLYQVSFPIKLSPIIYGANTIIEGYDILTTIGR